MTELAVVGYLGKRRTRSQWSQVIRGFAGADLSVSQYCAKLGVSEASFYRWRSLLGESGGPVRTAIGRVMKAPNKDFVDLGPLDRMPHTTQAASPAEGRIDVRVDLGGGVVLTVSRG